MTVCIFPPHKKFPSQNTSTYQSAGTVTVLFSLTPSSNLAGLLCALPARWCAFCLYEKEFVVVTFITACHREARAAFLVSSLDSVGLISKLPRVSGDLQHQTSVTQTSLWFLYMYFMFFFQCIFLEKSLADKQYARTHPVRHLISSHFGSHASVVV